MLRPLPVFLLGIVVFPAAVVSSAECACKTKKRPDVSAKAETARWMVHSLDWGVISTISSRLGGDGEGGSPAVPFGNVYSFVDGSCEKSTGIPYLYGSYMDQSFADSLKNDMVSLTLSESSLPSVCPENGSIESCDLGTAFGDPENPMCARLTLTGKLTPLEDGSDERDFAESAFFERHASMKSWPAGHAWVIAKIEIEDVWLIDYFGGATVLDPEEYFAASSSSANDDEEVQ